MSSRSLRLRASWLGLLASVLAPALASAQVPAFPAAWSGDWEIEIQYTHAGESDAHLVETITDSICTGDVLGLEPFGPFVQCSTHAIDANGVQLDCGGQAAGAGCSGQGTLVLGLTRTGDSLTGAALLQSQVSGSCPSPPLDEQIAVSGLRVASTPTSCGPPAASFADKFVFLPDLNAFTALVQALASLPALGWAALLTLAGALGAAGWRRLGGAMDGAR